MSRILAIPAYRFNFLMENNKEEFKNYAKISVQNPEGTFNYHYKNSEDGVLVTSFWDIESPVSRLFPDEGVAEPMSEEQGLEIVEFVRNFKNRNFLIHCTAGISRSGAIATFIHEYLTANDHTYTDSYDEFRLANRIIIPNNHILTTLRKLANL